MGLYMANELFSIQMLQDVYHSEAPTVSIHVCTQRHTFRGRNTSEVPWGAYHVHVKLVQTGAGSKKESEQSTWHIAEELGILHPSRERASIHGFGKTNHRVCDNCLVTTYAERYSVR